MQKTQKTLKQSLKKFLILSLGMTSFLGTMAFADEERSFRAGKALADGLLKLPKETPRTKLPNSPLVVYHYSMGTQAGAAAEIKEIARYKHILFLYTEFGDIHPIAYVTAAGADKDMQQILGGKSVDVTSCWSKKLVSSQASTKDIECRDNTYKFELECDELTPVPLISGIRRELYQPLSAEKAAPQNVTEERCFREHGGKI